MGHTEPKLAGGLKMKAYHESPYGDDVVTELMNHQVCFAALAMHIIAVCVATILLDKF